MVEEQGTKVQRILHPVHGRGGDIETPPHDLLLSEGEEPVLVVPDSQVT